MPTKPDKRPVCDYEGSSYRTDFWEGQGRDYEDRVERVALRRLLPPDGGKRLLEIGAGFGRLSEEYHMYDKVVLLDYSFSQLQHARKHLGDERFYYVAADAYKLPFKPGVFDGATMIRTIHHMSDVPSALNQVRRVLTADSTFILEHANKQNIKAVARYLTRRQSWNPFNQDPVEFVELNFDFHPEYIRQALVAAGFDMQRRVPVSFFRVGVLKKTLPTGLLAGVDGLLQHSGLLLTPSVFTKNRAVQVTDGPVYDFTDVDDFESLLACPESGEALERNRDHMVSAGGLRYEVRDGIYDFKAPLD